MTDPCGLRFEMAGTESFNKHHFWKIRIVWDAWARLNDPHGTEFRNHAHHNISDDRTVDGAQPGSTMIECGDPGCTLDRRVR